jgi:hypothetical protein
MKTIQQSDYPKGWGPKRVARLIAHFDRQTEDEAVAEYERAYRRRKESIVHVPIQLLPEIRRLIARHRKSA